MSDEEFGPLPRWRREPGIILSEEDRAKLDSIAGELGRADISSMRRNELLDVFFNIAAKYSPDPRLPHD
jgi:hypothetical protein